MKKIIGLLRLMRPANVVTAISDILAGVALSGFFSAHQAGYDDITWLILATVGLYGGGVVMNDVMDAGLDAVERPERPIPSGLVKKGEATALSLLLLAAGIICALMVSTLSGVIAAATAVAALIYDYKCKHHAFWGPLNMGLCRGLNLLLGLSIIPQQVSVLWFLAIVPIIYIAAITMISKGEVYGGRRSTLRAAAFLYALAMGSIAAIAVLNNQFPTAILFILLWAVMVFLPLRRAHRNPEGRMVGRAVQAGVLALILMNAAWAAAYGIPYLALIILLLLPLSLLLAKVFAVT